MEGLSYYQTMIFSEVWVWSGEAVVACTCRDTFKVGLQVVKHRRAKVRLIDQKAPQESRCFNKKSEIRFWKIYGLHNLYHINMYHIFSHIMNPYHMWIPYLEAVPLDIWNGCQQLSILYPWHVTIRLPGPLAPKVQIKNRFQAIVVFRGPQIDSLGKDSIEE